MKLKKDPTTTLPLPREDDNYGRTDVFTYKNTIAVMYSELFRKEKKKVVKMGFYVIIRDSCVLIYFTHTTTLLLLYLSQEF